MDFLALLDEHRVGTTIPGYRRERTAETCRFIDHEGTLSLVLHSRLKPETADAIIEREIAHFRGLGHAFEWKVFDHDRPADLRERLVARGFKAAESVAVLIRETRDASPASGPVTVRRLTDPDDVGDMLGIWQAAWPGEDQTHWARKIAVAMRERPGDVVPFVAYVDGRPASTGRVVFSPGDPFAYLGGGATRPEFRRRGLYTALLQARMAEAAARGVGHLMVDARPMSRPILEKRGFRFLGHATACTLSPERPPA